MPKNGRKPARAEGPGPGAPPDDSAEGTWRPERDPPIDSTLPVEAQLELAYRQGRLAERTRADAATEERNYLASIIDSSDDAVISKDLNGIIQSCNASAERIFGYSAAELIGQSVLILIPQERH